MADSTAMGTEAAGTEVDLAGMAGVRRGSHRTIATQATMAATAGTDFRIIGGPPDWSQAERRRKAEMLALGRPVVLRQV